MARIPTLTVGDLIRRLQEEDPSKPVVTSRLWPHLFSINFIDKRRARREIVSDTYYTDLDSSGNPPSPGYVDVDVVVLS